MYPTQKQQPCHFPFTYKSRIYSQCVSGAVPGSSSIASSSSFCSTSYNLDNDGSWGLCESCKGVDGASYQKEATVELVLSPFEASPRWEGTIAQLAAVIGSSLYYLRLPPSPYSEFPLTDQVTLQLLHSSSQETETAVARVGISILPPRPLPAVLSTLCPPSSPYLPGDTYYCNTRNGSDSLVPLGLVFGLENEPLSIRTLSVGFRLSPDLLSPVNWRDKVIGVSVAVDRGLLSFDPSGLIVTSDHRIGSNRNWSAIGSVHAVNTALQSMVYLPDKYWHSALASREERERNTSSTLSPPLSAVQRVSFTLPPQPRLQRVEVLQVAWPSAQNDSEVDQWTLQMDCSLLASSGMVSSPVIASANLTETVSSSSSYLLLFSATSEDVQSAVSSLLANCPTPLAINQSSSPSSSPPSIRGLPEVRVRRVPFPIQPLVVKNINTTLTSAWEVTLLAHSQSQSYNEGGTIPSPRPLLFILTSQLASSSVMLVSTTDLQSSTTSQQRRFRLGWPDTSPATSVVSTGVWTDWLSVDASAAAVQVALQNLSVVNSQPDAVAVIRRQADSMLTGGRNVDFEITFCNSAKWLPRFPSLASTETLTASPNTPFFIFGKVPALYVDTSTPDMQSTVSVVQEGYARPDLLRVLVSDLGADQSIGREEATVMAELQILIRPLFHPPALSATPELRSALLHMEEDQSPVALRGLAFSLPCSDRACVDSGVVGDGEGEGEIMELLVTLSSLFGTVSTHSPLSLSMASSPDTTPLILRGSLPIINELLALTLFSPLPDFHGPTTIDITYSTPTSSYSVYLNVSVASIPDTPVITMPSPVLLLEIGQGASATPLTGLMVENKDEFPSSLLYSGGVLVTIETNVGQILTPQLVEISPGEAVTANSGWQVGKKVFITGSVAAVNRILSLSQLSAGEESGLARGSLTISVSTTSNSTSPMTAKSSVPVRTVSSQTAFPTLQLTLPSQPVELLQGGSMLLLNWAVSAITWDVAHPSPSSSSAYVELLLLCETGRFYRPLPITPGLSEVEVGGTSHALRLRAGSSAELTQQLREVTFTLPDRLTGSVLLSAYATLDPLGAAPAVASASLLVLIRPVDHPPVVALVPNRLPATVVSDSTPISWFEVSDEDDWFALRIKVSVVLGTVSLEHGEEGEYELFSWLWMLSAVSDANKSTLSFMVHPSNATKALLRW